jgi:hypothetical protein
VNQHEDESKLGVVGNVHLQDMNQVGYGKEEFAVAHNVVLADDGDQRSCRQ